MAQNINQFAQAPVKGQLDLNRGSDTIACQIDSSSAGGLLPGQPVKLVNVAGGIPNVVEIAAITDDVFGFIAYSTKDASFGVGAKADIAFFRGAVMVMEASAAIVPGAKVMPVLSGVKVVTASGTGNRIIGFAIDKASANGDLIRVGIDLPGSVV